MAHNGTPAQLYIPPEEAGDSRPDLVRDSPQWGRLLALALRDCRALWGPLHGLRCLGARLGKGPGGWRITSDDPDYGQDRETYLLPKRAELGRLLGKIDPPAE